MGGEELTEFKNGKMSIVRPAMGTILQANKFQGIPTKDGKNHGLDLNRVHC